MGHTFSMARSLVFAVIALAALVACERERVEVGEVSTVEADSAPSDSGPESPMFPRDAQVVVDAGCAKEPPPVAACKDCPNGFKIIDGKQTCDCCE